ncbi:hypothetical protein C1645_829474, partial [Glomus cerebriforme]
SSPNSLFKFKFTSIEGRQLRQLNLESLKLFFDNWKDRHPILLLQTCKDYVLGMEWQQQEESIEDLIEEYKAKGIIKKYINNVENYFKWIQDNPIPL